MIVHYLQLVVFPRGLVISYFDWPIVHDLAPAVFPGAALLLALLVLSMRSPAPWRWWPGVYRAWFFLILGPTSSVLPNFTEIAAERRMYLPLASIVGACRGGDLAASSPERSSALLCVTLGAARRWRRNRDYQSAIAALVE